MGAGQNFTCGCWILYVPFLGLLSGWRKAYYPRSLCAPSSSRGSSGRPECSQQPDRSTGSGPACFAIWSEGSQQARPGEPSLKALCDHASLSPSVIEPFIYRLILSPEHCSSHFGRVDQTQRGLRFVLVIVGSGSWAKRGSSSPSSSV